MKTLVLLLLLPLAAVAQTSEQANQSFSILTATFSQAFPSTISGSSAVMGPGSSTMSYGSRPFYGIHRSVLNYYGTDPSAFYGWGHTQVNAVRGGSFSASSQSTYPAYSSELIGRTKGQLVGHWSYQNHYGFGNNMLVNGVLGCFGGSPTDTVGQCTGIGEIDLTQGNPTNYATGNVFVANITGSPAANATTFTYTTPTNETVLGERWIINKTRPKVTTGTITTITAGATTTTIVFTGATDMTVLNPVGRLLIIGDTNDWYTGPCANASYTPQVDGTNCSNTYWEIVSVTNASTIVINGVLDSTANYPTTTPQNFAIVQAAKVTSVDIPSKTFTIGSNSYTWVNGDVIYMTPNPHQQMMGMNIILRGTYFNMGRDAGPGVHVGSVGLAPREVAFEADGKWLYGLRITNGQNLINGIDFSGAGTFSDSAFRLPCTSSARFAWGTAYMYCDGTGLRMSNRLVVDTEIRSGTTAINRISDQGTYVRIGPIGSKALYFATADVDRCGFNSAGTLFDCTGGGQTVDFMARSWFGNGGLAAAVTDITTANCTYTMSNLQQSLHVDTTSGVCAVNLPPSPNAGQRIRLRRTAGANNITAQGNGRNIVAPGAVTNASTYSITDSSGYIFIYDSTADKWVGDKFGGSGGGGGATIASTTSPICGDGAGNGVACSAVTVPFYPIGPFGGGGMNDVMAGVANGGDCFVFYTDIPRAFTAMSFYVTTGSGNCGGSGCGAAYGVYNSSKSLIGYTETGYNGHGTSTKDINTTGTKTLNWSGGSSVSGGTLSLAVGKYFVCESSNSTVLAIHRWNNLGIYDMRVADENGYASSLSTGSYSSLAMAASFTTLTFSGSGSEPPMLIFK